MGLNPGGFYTAQVTLAPELAITRTAADTRVSWTIPSNDFVLQRSSSVSGRQWMTLPNSPETNLATLRYETTILPGAENGFYQLSSP